MRLLIIISLITAPMLYGMGKISTDELRVSYSDREKAIFKSILATAPEGVNTLHKRFKDESREYRAALFFGDPGAGKTECAKAIAHEARFNPFIIRPNDIGVGFYSETANKLTQILSEVENIGTEVAVIFDEADKMFDHPEQENRDTIQTASAMWTWLDGQKGKKGVNKWVFFTANDGTVFPAPLINRCSGTIYEFKLQMTPEKKAEAMTHFIKTEPGVTDDFKEQMAVYFKKYPQFAGRDFATIAQTGYALWKDDCDAAPGNKKPAYIFSHFERAMEKIHKERIATKYYEKKESNYDQTERHYRNGMRMNGAGLGVGAAGVALQALIAAGKIGAAANGVPIP